MLVTAVHVRNCVVFVLYNNATDKQPVAVVQAVNLPRVDIMDGSRQLDGDEEETPSSTVRACLATLLASLGSTLGHAVDVRGAASVARDAIAAELQRSQAELARHRDEAAQSLRDKDQLYVGLPPTGCMHPLSPCVPLHTQA